MYQHISGPDHTNTGLLYAKISVLPKSSYMGMCLFLNTYATLLYNPTAKIELRLRPTMSHVFNKKRFKVGHFQCPEFTAEATEQELASWYALAYPRTLPWNMQKGSSEYDEYSEYSRLVFIYRNPLDQLISHYKYFKKRERDDQAGPIDLGELENFIFKQNALSAYIKMFYSFHIMRQKHPEHILFVPYEELLKNRVESMLRIFRHLDLPYNQSAFNRALQLTSLANLKAEQQQTSKFKHIRNGGIGVWQAHLTPQIVQKIEQEMQKFGLSLTMFHIADELDPKFAFLQTSTSSRSTLTCRI